MEIQQNIPHNNQPRHPNSRRESIERWGRAYCRGGGLLTSTPSAIHIKMGTSGHIRQVGYRALGATYGGQTIKNTVTQQSTSIGQQLQASVLVQEGPKDKYNAQKSK